MLEALVSLPIISYFALPMLSSYSTSLNLLFFYMTWTTLVLSHTPLNVELYGTLAIRLVFYVLPSLLFLGVDAAFPSLSEGLKAHGERALPGRHGNRKLGWVAAVSVFNVLLGVALQVGVEVLFTKVLSVRSAMQVTTRLPSPWHAAKHIVYAYLIRNTAAYFIHRDILHSRNALANLHAQYFHSLHAPFSFAAHYDHPLPYLLHRFLPTYLPALLFRFHILTYHIFLILISLEELFTYSGYTYLPSTIILTGMARRQDAHVLSGGKGNFGPWGVLDWVYGTTVGKDVMRDLEREMEKHDVQNRAEDAVGGALEGAGGMLDGVKDRLAIGGRKGRGKK